MRYLITGGAGYAGCHIRQALLASGHQVVSVDLSVDPTRHARLVIERADIADQAEIERIFRQHGPFDAVFHCASQRFALPAQRTRFRRTNVHATLYLAEACLRYGIPQMVFLSSANIYGDTGTTATSEAFPASPKDDFGRAKLACESMFWQLSSRLNTVMLRVPTVIGLGRPGMLSLLFELVREGRRLPVIGKGEQKRQYVWAEDLADACVRAAKYDGTVALNIGSEVRHTTGELIDHLAGFAGTGAHAFHLPGAASRLGLKGLHQMGLLPGGTQGMEALIGNYVGDISAIQSKLNWQPTRSDREMFESAYYEYALKWRTYRLQSRLSHHHWEPAYPDRLLALAKIAT